MIQQPDIRPIKENGDLYELQEDYTYKDITVPKGFCYDGASVPRLALTPFGFQRDGIHRPAALVHDWLYVRRGWNGDQQRYSREDADRLFKEMLIGCGVKGWHVAIAYAFVRAFGWIAWDKR